MKKKKKEKKKKEIVIKVIMYNICVAIMYCKK